MDDHNSHYQPDLIKSAKEYDIVFCIRQFQSESSGDLRLGGKNKEDDDAFGQ